MVKGLDRLDAKILDQLRQDGRLPVKELASRLQVPRATVQNRIQRLRDRGVLRGFTAVVDEARLGKPTVAYILASFQAGWGAKYRHELRELLGIPGVERVDLITGEWDALIRVRAPNLESLGGLVMDHLRTRKIVARTLTLPSVESLELTSRDGEGFTVATL